jgi:hypothetical protein
MTSNRRAAVLVDSRRWSEATGVGPVSSDMYTLRRIVPEDRGWAHE